MADEKPSRTTRIVQGMLTAWCVVGGLLASVGTMDSSASAMLPVGLGMLFAGAIAFEGNRRGWVVRETGKEPPARLPAAPGSADTFCRSCGDVFVAEADRFCGRCGAARPDAVEEAAKKAAPRAMEKT